VAPIVEKSVGDVVDVDDPRIADVHVPEIKPAGVIPGEERFAEAQRAPAEPSAETETPSWAAPPCD
jgi:hypothetical protein